MRFIFIVLAALIAAQMIDDLAETPAYKVILRIAAK